MAYIIGIDEAGYGPKLGPLVMASVAFAVPAPKINLWNSLKGAVSKYNTSVRPSTPACRKIRVCDSKKLFSQAAGIATLQRTVLPFISLLNDPKNTYTISFKKYLDLFKSGECEDLSAYPWYFNRDFSLFAPQMPLMPLAETLRCLLDKKNTAFCGVRLEYADAARFNNSILACNKSDFLFDLFANLVDATLNGIFENESRGRGPQTENRDPSREIIIYAGKHGGKNYYRKDIEEHFRPESTRVLCESHSKSSYKVNARGCAFTVHFLKDGEDAQFTIALASIFAKYTRELFLKCLNRFWMDRIPDLKPTAGYPADAGRFVEDIYPAFSEMQVPLNHLWRMK